MQRLIQRLRNQPLSQQLALAATGWCLLATLILVAVAARSTQSIQHQTLTQHAHAAAQQLATRASNELATGDRLGLSAELQFFTDQALFAGARALDIEGTELAISGFIPTGANAYEQTMSIDGNTAGTVALYLDLSKQQTARETLIWGLIALSVLLSTAVYALTRPMGQRLASNINDAVAQLDTISDEASVSVNEVDKLKDRIDSLPLDLLRSRDIQTQGDEHYHDTAILCIALKTLPTYLETLDESRLQAYVSSLHRMAYGSAGFYGGELSVIRQFGLAIFFTGSLSVGSPVLRAASCAWLLSRCSELAEKQERLSFMPGMAIGVSELGRGNDKDIYPGLYTQATLDDLLALANLDLDAILLSSHAAEDDGLTTYIGVDVIDEQWMAIGDISGSHLDLLTRQLHILQRAITPSSEDTPQGFLPF